MKTMNMPEVQSNSHSPLQNMEEWEDFLKERYPEPASPPSQPFQTVDPDKKKEQFRNYEADARPTVREFYRQNHLHQTYEFAKAKRKEFLGLNRRKMGIWEAMEYLNLLVDDSDAFLMAASDLLRREGVTVVGVASNSAATSAPSSRRS